MEILKKIAKAKEIIKHSDVKKAGRNAFSKYDYFLPEQVESLVFNACEKTGLLTKFDLIRNEFKETGILTIYDINSDEKLEYKMATAIPEIKATNIAQQLGGCVTYTERYLKMSAFGIVENALDFDDKDNSKKEPKEKEEDNRPWLSEKDKNLMVQKIQSGEYNDSKEFFNNLYKHYKVKKDYTEEFKIEFNSPFNNKSKE